MPVVKVKDLAPFRKGRPSTCDPKIDAALKMKDDEAYEVTDKERGWEVTRITYANRIVQRKLNKQLIVRRQDGRVFLMRRNGGTR